MGILDKFSDITVDNSKRLLPEDMEHCKVEEELFKDAYNAYLTAYTSVKAAFERHKQSEIHEYTGYIWDYCDCGVRDLKEKVISLKDVFIGRIVGYFNNKYHLNLSHHNPFDSSTYHDEKLNMDILTLEEVLNDYVFGKLEGLTFSECAIKQAMENNKVKCQEWNRYQERWNYEIKGKTLKFWYSISEQLPLLYFYDNNEKEICSELKGNKIESIIRFKNGSTSVKFVSMEFAVEFAKKYLGYIEMTDEEKEKLKEKSGW